MKIITTLLTIFCVFNLNAQIYTPSGTIQGTSGNNNVGIGTSTPTSQLSLAKVSSILGDPQSISLYEDTLANYGFAVNAARGGLDFCANQAAAGTSFRWFGGANKTTPKQLMVLLGNNQLGIGGSPVFGKLELFNTSYGTQAFSFYTNDGTVNSRVLIEHITTPTSQRVNFTSAFSTASGDANWTFEKGNVGIGTTNPSSKLSVLGSVSKLTLTGIDGIFDNLIKYGHKSDLESQTNYANRWHGIDATITAGNASDNKLQFRLYAGSSANLPPSEIMTLVGNGNVGIGTANPTNKLDVNGTIHSKEVKVDMNGWSDFVFKKDYDLPTLEEVEKHIVEKGHLDNIPSEEEVLKNGINLGEMNSKLLQKIEELTLYMIEIKKENMEMKSKQTELENTIKELKYKIK